MGNLASAVDELAARDWDALPGVGLLEEIVEVRRQLNRLEGVCLQALERADRTGAATVPHGTTAAFARSELHLSPQRAHRDVHLCRELADDFPGTAAALRDGNVSVEHASLIVSLRRSLSDDTLAEVEPPLVEFARRATPQELRRAVEHVRARFTPARDQAVDDQDDYELRRLHTTSGMHGNGLGQWQLHPVGHETVMTAIHALSKPIPGDTRTAAQRRADALVAMAELVLRAGQLPTAHGVRPHVSLIVPLQTTQARAGAPAADYGYGATSSAGWARRMACDADIARIVMTPVEEVLDVGRAVRTFTAAQVRAIVARDRHCIWPGCDAPAGWCDVHHDRHWADGGSTSVANGMLVCGRHHDRIHLYGHAIITGPGRYTVDLRPGSDPHWHGPPHRAGP